MHGTEAGVLDKNAGKASLVEASNATPKMANSKLRDDFGKKGGRGLVEALLQSLFGKGFTDTKSESGRDLR